MEYKTIPLADYELKAGSDGWTFTAYASTFGNRDHGGDIITKGAFASTLKNPNRDRPLLWQHRMDVPIGRELSLREDAKGLIGQWEIVDTQHGADAYKLMKKGVVRSMSIGYIPQDFKFQDGGDTRVLTEIDLLENSVVSIPMNDHARIQAVKHICASCSKEENDFAAMTLADISRLLTTASGAFSDRTRSLIEKLQSGKYDLTDSKRNDLHALLATFAGLDAVRSDAEALVKLATPEPEEAAVSEPTGDPPSPSVLALSVRLRRAKLAAREAGVEV